MKKSIAMILAIVMMMALVACGGEETPSSTPTPPAPTQSTTDVGDINKEQDVKVDETKTYKKEIRIGTTSIVELDFMIKSDMNTDRVHKLLHNQLIEYDWDELTCKPELAESWEVSEDCKTYTFKLRKGVKFSNGEELTADDVRYTFLERHKEMESTVASGFLNILEDIVCVDDYTVRVTLTRGSADLLHTLVSTSYSIVNREACEADPKNGNLIGTGGWKLDSWAPSEHVTLVCSEDSWVWQANEKTPTEKVVFRFYDEDAARTIALQNNEIDVSCSVSSADVASLQTDDSVKVYTFPAQTLRYIFINMQDGKLTEDVNLRKAVAFAMNYDELYVFATGFQAKSFWGKNQFALFEDFDEPHEYNPEKAKEYLTKGGYPNGGLELDVLATSTSEELAALIQAQLDAVGIKLNIVTVDGAGMTAAIKEGAYDMGLQAISLTTAGGRFSFICNPTSATNRSRYDNAWMREQYDLAAGLADEAKRAEIYKEIQIAFHNDAPYIPLFYTSNTIAFDKNLSGANWVPDTKFDFTFVKCEE